MRFHQLHFEAAVAFFGGAAFGDIVAIDDDISGFGRARFVRDGAENEIDETLAFGGVVYGKFAILLHAGGGGFEAQDNGRMRSRRIKEPAYFSEILADDSFTLRAERGEGALVHIEDQAFGCQHNQIAARAIENGARTALALAQGRKRCPLAALVE
jgi:hypothetical protein